MSLYPSFAGNMEWARPPFTNGVPNMAACVDDKPDEALEDENRRLKKMYAEMSMQAELLKEALGKK